MTDRLTALGDALEEALGGQADGAADDVLHVPRRHQPQLAQLELAHRHRADAVEQTAPDAVARSLTTAPRARSIFTFAASGAAIIRSDVPPALRLFGSSPLSSKPRSASAPERRSSRSSSSIRRSNGGA